MFHASPLELLDARARADAKRSLGIEPLAGVVDLDQLKTLLARQFLCRHLPVLPVEWIRASLPQLASA